MFFDFLEQTFIVLRGIFVFIGVFATILFLTYCAEKEDGSKEIVKACQQSCKPYAYRKADFETKECFCDNTVIVKTLE